MEHVGRVQRVITSEARWRGRPNPFQALFGRMFRYESNPVICNRVRNCVEGEKMISSPFMDSARLCSETRIEKHAKAEGHVSTDLAVDVELIGGRGLALVSVAGIVHAGVRSAGSPSGTSTSAGRGCLPLWSSRHLRPPPKFWGRC